jgi:hypothetical protein
LALWGCGKKSPTQTTPAPNAGQEQSFASQVQAYGVVVIGFVASFKNGLDDFTPAPPTGFSRPQQWSPLLSPPDTSWHGPGANPHQPGSNTWYWNHVEDHQLAMYDTTYVRFIPDIWGSDSGKPVTRVDWELLVNMFANNTQTNGDEAVWASYSSSGSDTTRTDGNAKFTASTTYNNVATSFNSQYTWINCTRHGWRTWPRTCSGSFTWTATSSYGTQNFNLIGFFTFSGGSGTGEANSNNVLFAKYVFNSDGTAYYTLFSENWQNPHLFQW